MFGGFAPRGIPGAVWVALAALAALSPGAVATAQQSSVVMLSLFSEDGDDGLAAELSDAVYGEASAVDEWEVSSNRPSLMQMTMANDCEITEGSCRVLIGGGLGVEQVVYGTLRRGGGDAVSVEVMMFDSSSGDIVASASTLIHSQDRNAIPAAATSLLRQLRGLPPEAAEAPVVAPVQDVEPVEQRRQAPAFDDESPFDGRPEPSSNDWIGYTLLGVSAVALGGAVFSWMQIDSASSNSSFENYRMEVGRTDPSISDVCKEAARGKLYGLGQATVAEVRDQCDRGATFETLQYVFLAAFAVSGGVGLYFVLDDDGDDDLSTRAAPRLAIEPSIGPHAGAITARLSF